MIPFAPPPGFTTSSPCSTHPPQKDRKTAAASFRAAVRRNAQLRQAAEVVGHIPSPGESIHTLMTGRYDLMLALSLLIRSRPDICEELTVATLAFSMRNVSEIAGLVDDGKVQSVNLLASHYFENSNPSIWESAREELVAARKQRLASARCHAKISLLRFSDGTRLVFEGSANLRTNHNWEQLTIINDGSLYDWHREWITAKMVEYDRKAQKIAPKRDDGTG